MSISRVFQFRRRVVAWLLAPLLLWCIDASAFAQQAAQEKPKAILRGVEVKSASIIIIKYEFTSEATGSYNVSIDLLRQGEPSFKVPVRAVSGDIGIVKVSSGIQEVEWEYAKDYPAGLAGDEYYFRINLIKATGGGSTMWYYIAGGAAVIGGVVAYLLLGKKATEQAELPPAPVRPAQ